MFKHVKTPFGDRAKTKLTPLGNPAEAETRRGNFDIKIQLSEKQ